MARQLMIAVKLTVVLSVLLGVVYPLAVTGIAQLAFPAQANGSLVVSDGKVIGSRLIVQPFDKSEYYHPRPSAAFNPDANARQDRWVSGGSNFGPTSKALRDRLAGDVKRELALNPGLKLGSVPADMVTASASGLDPHISPSNAFAQVARVAAARGMDDTALRKLVRAHVENRTFGFLGEPRVNVLMLNLELDSLTEGSRK